MSWGAITEGIHAILAVDRRLQSIEHKLDRILTHQEKTMTQMDDLTNAVTQAAQAETDMETRIDALIAALQSPPDSPQVAEAIANLTALKAKIGGFDGPQAPTAPAPAAPAAP